MCVSVGVGMCVSVGVGMSVGVGVGMCVSVGVGMSVGVGVGVLSKGGRDSKKNLSPLTAYRLRFDFKNAFRHC